jgi:hypothetical protein
MEWRPRTEVFADQKSCQARDGSGHAWPSRPRFRMQMEAWCGEEGRDYSTAAVPANTNLDPAADFSSIRHRTRHKPA